MIAGCPKCSARYRVDVDRIGDDGAKLRCTKCSAVFLVRAPQSAATVPAAPVAPVTPVAVEPESTIESEIDSSRLVLVADSDEARGKAMAETIRSWSLTTIVVHDGVEAMLTIQRRLPAAIVLDAALPKMFGFQVCEVVKRNHSLRDTTVVLVGAIHHQDRYRRDPSDLYGADVYVESPDLPDGLKPIFAKAGMSMESGEVPASAPASSSGFASDPAVNSSAASLSLEEEAPIEGPSLSEPELDFEPSSMPEPELSFELPPAPEAQAEITLEAPAGPDAVGDAEDPERTAERERAQRLARIAVSEMVLYQPEKFDKATRDGILEQALDLEIQEARALLRQRIGEEVRSETDFIIDELNRVARERGAQT